MAFAKPSVATSLVGHKTVKGQWNGPSTTFLDLSTLGCSRSRLHKNVGKPFWFIGTGWSTRCWWTMSVWLPASRSRRGNPRIELPYRIQNPTKNGSSKLHFAQLSLHIPLSKHHLTLAIKFSLLIEHDALWILLPRNVLAPTWCNETGLSPPLHLPQGIR